MNADTLRRLMRAIANGSHQDLERLAVKVIEAEQHAGHTKLADDLKRILNEPKSARNGSQRRVESARPLQELPVSRRHRDALATVVPREALEHQMVLPGFVEERFQRIEREYAAKERLGAHGLRPRKTILLYGPPGCGKTLGAKRLAWNLGLPLIKVRFDALISSYFGESASNLRAVFDMAEQQRCVLLLDECDFIARARGNTRDIGEASRIVNSLLQLMEEYDAPGLLVATTNVEAALDEALFRRFDEVLHVPLPSPTEIQALLQTTLSALRVTHHVNWQRLAGLMKGQAAAVTVKVARDAAKSAVLDGRKCVEERDLEAAITEIHRREDGAGN